MKVFSTLALLFISVSVSFAQIPTPGNVLWLKADAGAYHDAGVTLATNGQTVQQWNDQSGNAAHATCTPVGSRPTFVTNVLNGNPVLRFSNHYLQTPDIDLSTTDKTDMYVVYKSVAPNNNWEVVAEHGPDYNSYVGFNLFENAQAQTYNGIFTGISGGGYNYKDYPFKTNEFKIVNTSFDKAAAANAKVNLRINAKDITLYDQPLAASSGNFANYPLYIGNRGATLAYPLSGDIAEIILYNRKLTPTEKVTIESYLNTKYNIQCNVNNPQPGSGNCLQMGSYGAFAQDDADIDFGSNDFTVEFWTMKRALSGGGANSACVNKWNSGSAPGTNEWAVATTTDGNNNIPAFFFETGVTTYQANAATALTINKWYHIASVREGNNIKIYVNGILEGTTAIPPGSSVNNVAARTYMAMGYYPSGSSNNSNLDEVRIWNTALSQTTIRDWMCKKETSSHPNHASLTRYYRFDETSGTIFGDQVNNCVTEAYSNGGILTTSGAPIGDNSAYDYTANTATANINFGTPTDNLTATMNAGTSAGVHVYGVNELPNSTSGITPLTGNNKYAGVFVVNGNGSAAYTATYNYTNNTSVSPAIEPNLKLSKRSDNAVTSWSLATSQTLNTGAKTITATGQNTEYFLSQSITLVPPTCAVNFNGTAGAGVQVANNAAINLTTAYTYETWIKASTDITNYRAIINRDGYPNYAPGIFIAANSEPAPGKILVVNNIGGIYRTLSGTTSVNDNQWHHIATTYDGAAMKIYVDGVLENTLAATGSLYASTGPLGIGYNYSAANYPFIGKIDEVRIWNTARTVGQIIATMNTTMVGNETGLVLNYDFNNGAYNGSGQIVTNLCSNTGTVLNGITTGTASTPTFDCPNTNISLVSPTCGAIFNATSKVDVGNVGAMPAKGTVEFWIKPRSFSNYQSPLIMSALAGGSNNGLYFWIDAAGTLNGLIGNSNATYSYGVYGTLALNSNNHVALTWDVAANNFKGYLNGRLIFSQNNTYWPTALPFFMFGTGRITTTDFFNGDMDEIRFWNTERTQTEIVSNASSVAASSTGLQAYYHFNENALNGNGQTILNKATATAGTLNGTTDGYVKFPCSLNPPTCGITLSGAAGEGIQIPNNAAINLTNTFTYQTWIKASADVSNYRCLFSKGALATSAPSLMIASSGSGNGGKLYGTYYIGTTLFSFISATAVNDNEWHHIAYSYDGATIKLYIDGVLDLQQAATGAMTTNTSPLSIGYNFTTGNYPFVGKIDEFSAWNIARTQADIQNTMNTSFTGNETGLVAYYHFNDNSRSGQNRIITNFCTTTGSALNGSTFGTALTPVFDCAPPPFTAPECNMQTNGTTDQATVPNNASLGLNNFSIGAYVKTTDASGNYKNILWKDVDGSNANYALYITNTNKAQITFQRNPIVGQAPNATGTTTITDGSWHYLVGTYDGTNLKIYVDGVLDGTTATSSTPMTGPNPLYLASSAGSNKYNGSMDEISVWNRALSANEITGLIGQRLVGNETGLIAYYNFGGNTKNGQGITIVNSCTTTGSALNGTTIGTATTPIFTCSEIMVTPPACNLLMNGYNDHAYVNGTGAMSYPGVTNNFTMEVKAKALYPKGNSSGAQYDGVFSGQNYVLFPDQGGDGFAPGHAGVGISLGTNGVAVYEHSSNYMPARIIFNNYNTNDWVNLTVVSSNGLLKLYINGALVSTASASGYILHPSGHIGGYYGTFAGYVGEVRIWNAALTGDQIRTNLNANLTGSETNLISLFKFNNNTSNGTNKTITGLGSFGSANPYITNGTSCTPIFTCANTTNVNRDDMVGSGSMFNQNGGGISFAELGDLGNIPAQGSMMLWFNAASLKEKAFVFSSSHFRNSLGRYKGINLFTRSDGKLQLTFGTDTTASGYQDTVTVATNIVAGRWNHFAMSWDTVAKTYTTYLNGIQTATGSTNFWPAQLESFKAGIGLQPSSTYAWNGQIDELSEWNKILSLTEIRNQLASKINSSQSNYANVLHYYRFDNNTCGGNSLSDYKGTVHGMVYNTSLTTSSSPIGAYSSYQYAGNTSTTSLQIGNGQGGTDNVTATINTGTANGIHLYGEDNWPNTVTGVNDTVPGSKRYAGVYMVNPNTAAYTLLYDYTNNPYVTPVNESYLRLRKRDNNAVTTWGTPVNMILDETLNTVTCTGESTEYILAKGLFPLPLKWLSFTAQLNNNKQTLLNWKVSAEFNVSRYEIEWSRDGIHFTLIATTVYNAAAGGNYTALHVQPVSGNNYYRVKQVDVDGRYSYTNIQLIKLTDNMVISFYPNPAKDVVNIVGWDKIKQMQLYDISGRKLNEWKKVQPTITINNLSNGTYVLKAEMRSGEMIEQKLIVSK
ncbi:MAG: T9SS type A sorting domain-containing protein [Chitinophagaceae bacterium]|nr:T9SS type A sorting domain-containing protein [Chitinophagaceae bacterium]